jgi:hypothetical protein
MKYIDNAYGAQLGVYMKRCPFWLLEIWPGSKPGELESSLRGAFQRLCENTFPESLRLHCISLH